MKPSRVEVTVVEPDTKYAQAMVGGDRVAFGSQATFTMECAKLVIAAGALVPIGDVDARRQHFRKMQPAEVADYAMAVGEALFDRMRAEGLVGEVPPFATLLRDGKPIGFGPAHGY